MSTTYNHKRNPELDMEQKAKKQKESFSFPGRHQNGASNVYRKGRGYRDNSMFLEELFSHESNAICFTRPMQLGKTTLFSLADELYSVNRESNIDTDLSYSPDEGNRNKWYILRLDFGSVLPSTRRQSNKEEEEEWNKICESLDKETENVIKSNLIVLLHQNKQLNENFKTVSLGTEIKDQSIPSLIGNLSAAVRMESGRLLFLVDEYDQPIREGVLPFLPDHGSNLYQSVKENMRKSFRNYFDFFKAVKGVLETLPHAKIWLTGITPIGIKEMSGLTVIPLTFHEGMADAVGLTDVDVACMLDSVHDYAPFEEGERDQALALIKRNFNNLGFPDGQSLYHTALVNGMMNMLLKEPNARRAFLKNGNVPRTLGREPVPSSVFNVLCNARNLRHVVNKLAERCQITGYKINEQLSLEHLLRENIDIGDYLTLLVHVGVASAVGTKDNPTFSITSEFYRENLLEPLLRTLRVSLETLTLLTSTEDVYDQGEDILVDFVTSISKNRMASLISWASSDARNNILELQFQSNVVTEAHDILQGIAETTQEDILRDTGKRTDVTFSSSSCVVILELKQVASATAPAATFIEKAHKQLAGYVQTRRAMEEVAKRRPVAGFVVVMYNDGAEYIVEKLRNDNS